MKINENYLHHPSSCQTTTDDMQKHDIKYKYTNKPRNPTNPILP